MRPSRNIRTGAAAGPARGPSSGEPRRGRGDLRARSIQAGARKPVILRPRRTSPARSPSVAGRRIQPGALLSPGAAASTEAWASGSSRLADGGAFRMAPAHSPAALSPRPPLPQAGRKRERGRIRARFGRFRCVWLKPRTRRASGSCRGFPLFQPRVHPPLAPGPWCRPSLPPWLPGPGANERACGLGTGDRCRALAGTCPRLDPSPRVGWGAGRCGALGAQDDRPCCAGRCGALGAQDDRPGGTGRWGDGDRCRDGPGVTHGTGSLPPRGLRGKGWGWGVPADAPNPPHPHPEFPPLRT
jgi:hypothetical protein